MLTTNYTIGRDYIVNSSIEVPRPSQLKLWKNPQLTVGAVIDLTYDSQIAEKSQTLDDEPSIGEEIHQYSPTDIILNNAMAQQNQPSPPLNSSNNSIDASMIASQQRYVELKRKRHNLKKKKRKVIVELEDDEDIEDIQIEFKRK